MSHHFLHLPKMKLTLPPLVFVLDTDALVNQVLPAAQVNAQGNSGTKMPPPSGPPIVTAMAAAPVSIAPQPAAAFEQSGSYDNLTDDKRLQKREANRRSAQLSRKRKKQFTEELKEENDELRKKELILRSIPDLVLVFDSTGKLWFVSESVSRFLNFTAKELEGQSVWDRLCEDSTRLLKAAFMDALAARSPDSDTAPLGSGLWELRIVDKDNSQKVVTLNGVVHFSGDRPECVCSIRPSQQANKKDPNKKSSTEETLDKHYTSLICVHPQQSVVGNGGSGSSHRKGKRGREAMRISDSGNSSGESETASGSGSSDD